MSGSPLFQLSIVVYTKTRWCITATITCFAHEYAIWSGLRRDTSSLLPAAPAGGSPSSRMAHSQPAELLPAFLHVGLSTVWLGFPHSMVTRREEQVFQDTESERCQFIKSWICNWHSPLVIFYRPSSPRVQIQGAGTQTSLFIGRKSTSFRIMF